MSPSPVYFISADDDFLAANRAKEIFQIQCREVSDETSAEIIDASVNKASDAVEVCKKVVAGAATLSLFGGKKVVWARNANFINDGAVGKSKAVHEAVSDMAEALGRLDPSAVAVIINASPVTRTSSSYKKLASISESEDFSTKKGGKDAAQCIALVKQTAKSLGAELERGAAEALCAVVANNSRMAVQETQKLATYANGERPITEEDVADMVPIFGESDFFGITEAFYSGNLRLALSKLRRYFFADKTVSARPVITALQKQNSLLIQLRSLMDAKVLPKSPRLPEGSLENANRLFGKYFEDSQKTSPFNLFTKNSWMVNVKLANIASKHSLKTLMDIQTDLVKTFENLISNSGADEDVLKEFFIRNVHN